MLFWTVITFKLSHQLAACKSRYNSNGSPFPLDFLSSFLSLVLQGKYANHLGERTADLLGGNTAWLQWTRPQRKPEIVLTEQEKGIEQHGCVLAQRERKECFFGFPHPPTTITFSPKSENIPEECAQRLPLLKLSAGLSLCQMGSVAPVNTGHVIPLY